MFLLPRLQNNLNAKHGHLLTLSSTRQYSNAGVYSGSQGIAFAHLEADLAFAHGDMPTQTVLAGWPNEIQGQEDHEGLLVL
jgi:hypothetical protein